MQSFLFAIAVMFFTGVISVVCMVIALSLMLKNPGRKSKRLKIIMLILTFVSLGTGAFAAFGLLGVTASVIVSVILLIISILIWCSVIFDKKI